MASNNFNISSTYPPGCLTQGCKGGCHLQLFPHINKAQCCPRLPPSFCLRCSVMLPPDWAPFPSLLFFTCQSPVSTVSTHMWFDLRMSTQTHACNRTGPVCWITHARICLRCAHSSRRGGTTLICHAPRPPFITGTLIQHTSDVISLQLEIHQARGAFNCLVEAALPKPSPFSPSHLFWVSPRAEALGRIYKRWRFSISCLDRQLLLGIL